PIRQSYRAASVPVLRLAMLKTLEGGALCGYKPAHPVCIGSFHWLRATGSGRCVGATPGASLVVGPTGYLSVQAE
ncbi:MAG: hypothetical protein M3176_18445, partial [Chloroflexota bacterium]|nr:hypothetical protein [Chloroflexota bacterium]